MKFFLVTIVFLVSTVASAMETERFVISGGFGVKNVSNHRMVSDWNRYFLLSDNGVLELNNKFKKGQCVSLGFQMDIKSSRFFESSKRELIVSMSKGTPAQVCSDFFTKVMEVFSRTRPDNQAQIDIIRTKQKINEISITFEGTTTTFGE